MVKRKGSRKEHVKAEYLPAKLVRRLQEHIFDNNKYQYPTKNNFLACVSIIYYHQVTNGIGLDNYVPLGSNYWKTVFNTNYYPSIIEPLLEEHGIIQSRDYGYRTYPKTDVNPHRGKQDGLVGIRYRINPDLLDDQFESIHYINKRRVLTVEERVFAGDMEFMIADIPDLDYRISIDHEKVSNWVDTNAGIICDEFLKTDYIQAIPDNLKIECRELIEVAGNWSYNPQYRSIGSAKLVAETRGKELFYFNDSFFIADIKEFMAQRIESLKYHYKQQISKIGRLPIEEKRNPVTLRLYSSLTNFPSKVLQFVNINNKTVVQLDLRTSQFLLFANLLNTYVNHGEQGLLKHFNADRTTTYLKKLAGILKQHQNQLPEVGVDFNDSDSGQFSSSDVTAFIRDVFFADFYDVIQHELGLQDRLLAKHVMFRLLFKKTNRPDALLSKLSQRYPVVMSIIAEFKKRHGGKQTKKNRDKDDEHESNFSVFLSCVEGEIFVDNILKKLREEGIPCFTRHDSVVVASGHEDRSEAVAKQVFKDFGFRYNHRIDDKFLEVADPDELEYSDYMQWLIDENELYQDYYVQDTLEEPEDEPLENDDIMDEEHQETINRLIEIGTKDTYAELIDAVFMEEISQLPFLNQDQQNVLLDEVNNINYGMPIFQQETDELLRHIIFRFA